MTKHSIEIEDYVFDVRFHFILDEDYTKGTWEPTMEFDSSSTVIDSIVNSKTGETLWNEEITEKHWDMLDKHCENTDMNMKYGE